MQTFVQYSIVFLKSSWASEWDNFIITSPLFVSAPLSDNEVCMGFKFKHDVSYVRLKLQDPTFCFLPGNNVSGSKQNIIECA